MAREKAYGKLRVGQTLSPREIITLKLAADGLSTKEIAAELNCSTATVHTHLGNTYFKINAKNLAHAVAMAFSAGLLYTRNVQSGSVPIADIREAYNKAIRFGHTDAYVIKDVEDVQDHGLDDRAWIELDTTCHFDLFHCRVDRYDADYDGWSHTQINGWLPQMTPELKNRLGKTVLTNATLPARQYCPVGQMVLVEAENRTDGKGCAVRIRWPQSYDANRDQRLNRMAR